MPRHTDLPSVPAAKPAVEEVTAHRGHPGWRMTLYTMWVAQLCSIMGFSFVMPFIPFYIRELGVTDERLLPIWSGVLVSGAGIAMAVMGPIWGGVADRYGRKLMVQRAMFGGAVVLTLMGFVRNVRQLLALRIIQGTITGTVPASVALVSSVVPRASLGFSLGLMQMAVFSGSSIGPYLGGMVADRFGYRVPFAVTGALLLTGGMLVLFGARERFVKPAARQRDQTASVVALLRTRGVFVLLALYFMMNLSGSFVAPIFPLFVERIVGKPAQAATETGLLLAVTGLASAFSSVATGRLSDRLGHKRMLIICTTTAAVLSFPHAIAHSLWQLMGLRVLFGFGVGGMAPAMNALVASTVPSARLGRAYGFTTTASALGMACGPVLGGWAASAAGYRLPFVFMGAMLLILAVGQSRGLQPREVAARAPALEAEPAADPEGA